MTKQHEVYLLVGGHSDGRGGGSGGGLGSSVSRGSGDWLDDSASKVLALQTQDLSQIPRIHIKKRLAGTYMLNMIYIVAHPVYPKKLFSVK